MRSLLDISDLHLLSPFSNHRGAGMWKLYLRRDGLHGFIRDHVEGEDSLVRLCHASANSTNNFMVLIWIGEHQTKGGQIRSGLLAIGFVNFLLHYPDLGRVIDGLLASSLESLDVSVDFFVKQSQFLYVTFPHVRAQ